MKPALQFIGQIETPYHSLSECPMNIDPDGPLCAIQLDQAMGTGLVGLSPGERILVLYWFENVERDVLLQKRRDSGRELGVFALRSPHRPNPIGAAVVKIERIEDRRIVVRGLDCLNGTPLLDIKPAMRSD
jgi:tRNA-Thr(GGU) m(6)t(6)A37 methyltransferase TsaA